jgi:protein-disulfide isomerase
MHKNARADAIAVLCSAEQGKYMDYKKAIYSLEKTKSGKSVSDSERVALATGLGMDESKFSACLSTRAYENQVAADIKLGESKGVTGTPTIYLDGVKLDMGLFRDTAGFRSFLESRIK